MAQGEALYKTVVPEELERAEYYQVTIHNSTEVLGPRGWFLRETHGWWDEEARKPRLDYVTLHSSEEPFYSREEAEEAYEKQVRSRARDGFCHAFRPPTPFENGTQYRRIETS